MTCANKSWTELGIAPTVLLGPLTAAGVSNQGVPQPQFAPGTTVDGNGKGKWVLCTLVLASTTTLANGQAYVFDRNFLATLLTTANSPRAASVGIGSVSQASVVAGTYYIWLQILGHAPVQYTGNATAAGETTATGGLVNFNNTPTATAKTIIGIGSFVASQTFTANTSTVTPRVLTNVSSFNDVAVGASLAGTGIGASAKIVSFGVVNGDNQIVVDVDSTATGTGITITQTGVITANLTFPHVGITN